MSDFTSKTISALRLPLAVMVVFIHSFGQPGLGEYSVNWNDLTGFDLYNILRILLSHVIPHVAVPSFFLISGYLFFVKMESPNWMFYKKQYKKRLKTLFLPYIIWNVFTVLWFVPFKIGGVLFHGKPWGGIVDYLSDNFTLQIFWHYNVRGGGRLNIFQQVMSPHCVPMLEVFWFIRDLMLVVIFAPLICWLLRKTKGYILLLFALIYLLHIETFGAMPETALLFFSIGAWFAIRRKGFAEFSAKHFSWAFPLWLLFIGVEIYYDGFYTEEGWFVFPFMVLVGVFAFIGLVARYGNVQNPIRSKLLQFAADNTFFIYVAHGFIGLELSWYVLTMLPIPLLLQYLLAPFSSIGICLILIYLMRRCFPKITSIAVGER